MVNITVPPCCKSNFQSLISAFTARSSHHINHTLTIAKCGYCDCWTVLYKQKWKWYCDMPVFKLLLQHSEMVTSTDIFKSWQIGVNVTVPPFCKSRNKKVRYSVYLSRVYNSLQDSIYTIWSLNFNQSRILAALPRTMDVHKTVIILGQWWFMPPDWACEGTIPPHHHTLVQSFITSPGYFGYELIRCGSARRFILKRRQVIWYF